MPPACEARPARALCPTRRIDLKAFPVANEVVLLSPEGERAYTLNESSAAIWELCDGKHSIGAMLDVLRMRYAGDDVGVLVDVAEALLRFRSFGLIDTAVPARPGSAKPAAVVPSPAAQTVVRFVFGIEDRAYFHWQLAILFESLVGQLPPGWDITVVVCNDHAALSPELTRLLDVYGVSAITGANHGRSHDIDFSEGRGGYVALNRVEALSAIADYVEADDVVCLMDTDVFLFGEIQPDLFPSDNAMAENEIIGGHPFMGFASQGRGVDLDKLLASMGCDTPLKPGGVTVFLTGATIRNKKVLRDCYRFAQVLFLLGKVLDLPPAATWVAEMACFSMALTPNGIDYTLLDVPQFTVLGAGQDTVPEGSFYHYYCDLNDGGGPFRDSEWHKQLFADSDFLQADLESFRAGASSILAQRFFDLALAARRRIGAAAVAAKVRA
jgi:hypothetical protein